MEIKITIEMKGVDPIEIKVDVPVEGEKKDETVKRIRPDVGVDARWFNKTCSAFCTGNAELNKYFLIQQQDFCNEKLRRVGYLTLNEAYDCLGMVRTGRGQRVGWIYDMKNSDSPGYVDFGLWDERNSDFINGLTDVALLDFNVDGDILQYL